MQKQRTANPYNSCHVGPEAGSAAVANHLPYVCPVVFALILPILIGISRPPVLDLYADIFYVFMENIGVAH